MGDNNDEVTNAFRLKVQFGLPAGYQLIAGERRLVTNAFRLKVQFGQTERGSVSLAELKVSQTPFG